MNKQYFIFAIVKIKRSNEVVYLNADKQLTTEVTKDTLMLFTSKQNAIEYAESKGWDKAEVDCIDNF